MAYGFDRVSYSIEDYMDAEELDGFRSALASMLLDTTELEPEFVYSLVFSSGRRIVWH